MVRRKTKEKRACESPLQPRQNGLKCRKCHAWACSAACGRAVVDLHCCRLTGIVSHECINQSHSEGLGSWSAKGAPRLTQGMGQAMDVRMADMQCDQQSPSGRVACQAALQVVPTTPPAMSNAPMEVETGQPMQIDMATPRAGQVEPEGNAEPPDPTAVVSWSEEQLLELATSLPAMRTIRHQPRGLRHRTCTILKKLLQHHTHCRHQWVKRRDSESFQAELAAARWAWLGPALLVRAYEGGEHADDEGLTPEQRRKPSIEPAGKRATLAETGAWMQLLRMYVRDLLSREVYARGDGTHTLQQSTTLKADTMSAAEAVQAAKLHSEILPDQQAILLSAAGPDTAMCWTAMHKSPTELAQNGQSRMARALRLGATLDLYMCSEEGQRWEYVRANSGDAPVPPVLLQARRSQKQTAPRSPVHSAQAHPAGRELRGHGAPCP